MTYEDNKLLREAHNTVFKNREMDYGDPVRTMERIAKVWSAILGVEIPPDKVPLCMTAVKLVRQSSKHKHDNIVDTIGYSIILDMMKEGH